LFLSEHDSVLDGGGNAKSRESGPAEQGAAVCSPQDRGCSASAITLSPPPKHDPEKWHDFRTIILNNTSAAWRDGNGRPEVHYASATGNDLLAHELTYRNFVTLVKVSLAVVVVILILMAYFLT
jgi:hypothetical protein